MTITGVTVLDTLYLIPFKAKAWIDLSDRKAAGEQVDSKNIRKHKNDIFRLTELLTQEQKVFQNLPVMIEKDMREFFRRIVTEEVDLVQLGILGRTKEDVFRQLRHVYGV